MKIYFDNNFFTDNSLECEPNCFWVKTQQNTQFENQAKIKGAKIISLNECKKLLNINNNIKIIGITGTNGKTTTAAIIYHILRSLGYSCLLCGTRGVFIDDKLIDQKGLTTTPILKTISYLYEASKLKCDFCIMEVSSHALVQNRIESLDFSAKIFTNITQDHLDFHKTFKDYKKAKESFFMDDCLKFINKDALNIKYNSINAIDYGVFNGVYKVKKYNLENGIKANLILKNKELYIKSKLNGLFNLYNILAAISCINELLNPNLNLLQQSLTHFCGVSGRCELVYDNVIIDFAHTPDGIEKLLESLKYKNLIVVFGAGGNRDQTKRPLMAKIVEKYAKIAIVTSDNPRNEDPKKIIKDIYVGFTKNIQIIKEIDRKKAIFLALSLKTDNDFVVILGKGDEMYQEILDKKIPFNDKEIVLKYYKI